MLVPVNLGNQHWCCLIVSISTKAVVFYDSMNSTQYKKALHLIAWEIVRDTAVDFEVVSMNTPIQFNGHSYGFYVCLQFWCHVDRTISRNVLEHSNIAFRFKLGRFVLSREMQ